MDNRARKIVKESVMFGTVIIDAYRKEETIEMALAIENLCSPNGNYGWASAGIYCFWNYYTKETLYIGLAGDLTERFKQHNGIISVKTGSKKKEIEEYFSKNEKLGYTIFVQTPLSQPIVHRNKKALKMYFGESDSLLEMRMGKEGRENIEIAEGILIEAYRRKYKQFPKWNIIGGSVDGQKRVMDNNINIVYSFCHPSEYDRCPMVSRSSIRELSNNPEYAWYENYLHGVRMNMLTLGMEYQDALEFIEQNDMLNTYQEMEKMGYLKKILKV